MVKKNCIYIFIDILKHIDDIILQNFVAPPTPSTPPVEEDMHAELPQERIKQFQYILMDLNAKFCSQNFKPS